MEARAAPATSSPAITVRDLTMAYWDFVLQRHLDFTVERGDIFVVMGGRARCSSNS